MISSTVCVEQSNSCGICLVICLVTLLIVWKLWSIQIPLTGAIDVRIPLSQHTYTTINKWVLSSVYDKWYDLEEIETTWLMGMSISGKTDFLLKFSALFFLCVGIDNIVSKQSYLCKCIFMAICFLYLDFTYQTSANSSAPPTDLINHGLAAFGKLYILSRNYFLVRLLPQSTRILQWL